LLKPADGRAEWSITCFFVRRDVRGRGVSGALVKAAVAHVAKLGGKIVEAYPVDALKGRLPAVSAYTGLAASFRKLGLQEVARNAPGRPILRLTTGD
jgi:GNAT superfamily N-acetyltransferase